MHRSTAEPFTTVKLRSSFVRTVSALWNPPTNSTLACIRLDGAVALLKLQVEIVSLTVSSRDLLDLSKRVRRSGPGRLVMRVRRLVTQISQRLGVPG